MKLTKQTPLDQVVRALLDAMTREGYAQNTILAYRHRLRTLLAWAQSLKIDTLEGIAAEGRLQEFIDSLVQSNVVAPSTLRVTQAALVALQHFALTQTGVAFDAQKLQLPEYSLSTRMGISDKEVTELVNAACADGSQAMQRFATIVMLLRESAVDMSRLITLRRGQFDEIARTITYEIRGRVCVTNLSPRLAGLLQSHFDLTNAVRRPPAAAQHLIVTSKGKGYTRQGVWKMLQVRAQELNPKLHITMSNLQFLVTTQSKVVRPEPVDGASLLINCSKLVFNATSGIMFAAHDDGRRIPWPNSADKLEFVGNSSEKFVAFCNALAIMSGAGVRFTRKRITMTAHFVY